MDKVLILSKIKEYYSFNSDADFARYLGITPQNLKHWYTRNTFDISILATKCNAIDPYWIITGEGDMLKNTSRIEITNHAKDSNIVSMPADVWEVIKNQAESLKSKDAQTSEMLELLKEQMKKSYRAEHQFRAANLVVEEDE